MSEVNAALQAIIDTVRERDALRTENARMREALEKIADGTYEDFGPYKAEAIAHAALEVKP